MRPPGSSERNDSMEYVIAAFVGIWIAVAGLLAYRQIAKDFADVTKKDNSREEGAQK